jgi:putative Ca2+/H+ antiporter (TMEM165/GDT1 family)
VTVGARQEHGVRHDWCVTGQLAALGIAFGLVLLVELPDKTLVATLVLSTRYRPQPVLVGVAAAFAVQCAIAVTAGGLLHLLPRRVVEAVVALLFAVGAVLLIRESLGEPEHVDVEAAAERQALPSRRIALTSFGVLFAAEWGDASQIATAGLAARQSFPLGTAIGAWLALVAVAVVAALAGRVIVRRVPVRIVHRVAGVLFAAFAVLAAVAAVRG